MKRTLCVTLVILLLLTFTGCKDNSDSYIKPANFYYSNTSVTFFKSDAVIAHEVRETVNYNDNIVDILNAYLKGPVSDKLSSPFPTGLRVVATQIINDSIVITFNNELASLSGLDLTIACSCICATVAELTGYNRVEFKSDGSLPDNLTSLVFSYDELLFIDDAI